MKNIWASARTRQQRESDRRSRGEGGKVSRSRVVMVREGGGWGSHMLGWIQGEPMWSDDPLVGVEKYDSREIGTSDGSRGGWDGSNK